VRHQLRSTLHVLHSQRTITNLIRLPAQQIPGFAAVGLGSKKLATDLLRLLKTSRLVVINGERQSLGDCFHRD